uniref:Uncharacterized protein n=1 Tax=Megaselia scalaris TaxID=36166 RepID=T1GG07_MEGSC
MQWEDFYRELLNGSESRTSPHKNQSKEFQNNDDVPKMVDKAIQREPKPKKSKSIGTDGIPAELLKTSEARFNSLLHNLIFHQILTNRISHTKVFDFCQNYKSVWAFATALLD